MRYSVELFVTAKPEEKFDSAIRLDVEFKKRAQIGSLAYVWGRVPEASRYEIWSNATYFGPEQTTNAGYWPEIHRAIAAMRHLFPDRPVFYGGHGEGGSVFTKEVTPELVAELWEIWNERHPPYMGHKMSISLESMGRGVWETFYDLDAGAYGWMNEDGRVLYEEDEETLKLLRETFVRWA